MCPNITTTALPAATPATSATITISICVTTVILVTCVVAGVYIWTLMKRVSAAEDSNRRLHRLLAGGAERLVTIPPAETHNIRAAAAAAGGPYDTGYASTPRRSPFATVSPGGQYARFTRVPHFDPSPPLSTFSSPFPTPRVPSPHPQRGPIPWPLRSESWLGF